MKLNKLGVFAVTFAAILAIAGCTGPDGDNTTITIDASTGAGGGTISLTCPAWTTPRAIDVATGKDVCALPTTILEDRDLTNSIIWLMEGRVTVGNGNGEIAANGMIDGTTPVLNVELSIQSGTELRGLTGTFANLIITRGSKIFARGTADAPILMSSSDDDLDGTGEWGGLIIHGYGEQNNCYDNSGSFLTVSAPLTPGVCNVDAEGESGFAGGFDNGDDSGIIQYLIVAEGGFEFAVGNEINGISFVAVGSGTTVDHIQVHNNADDGIEMYGGAVSMSHVVLTSNFDDSIDWDEGWQGNLQFVLVIQNNNGGNAIEADTTGNAGTFHSLPVLVNVTLIGGTNRDDLAVFKASSAGLVFNSIFTGLGGAPYTNCALSAAASEDAGTLKIENSITNCDTVDSGGNVELAGNTSVDPGLDAAFAATAGAATLGAPVDLSAFEATDSLYDNRSADLEDDDDFFIVETDYAGAVEPGTVAAEAWYADWTVDGSL